MRTDQEEADDRVRLGIQPGDVLDIVIETPNRGLYVDCLTLGRAEHHLFRFFLDGSARTFYIGNVVEGDRHTAIHVAQIGAAAVVRNGEGRMRVADLDHKVASRA